MPAKKTRDQNIENTFPLTVSIVLRRFFKVGQQKHFLRPSLVGVFVASLVPTGLEAQSFRTHNANHGIVKRTKNALDIYLNFAPALVSGDGPQFSVGSDGTLNQMLVLGGEISEKGVQGAFSKQISKGIAGNNQLVREVRIRLPSIDYGFTGVLDKLLISVKGRKNGKNLRYRTIIMEQFSGNPLARVGTVTIEAYTPYFLKGTYSGAVSNPRDLLPDTRPAFSDPSTPRPPPMPTSGAIRGEFMILNPWQNDYRVELDLDNSVTKPFLKSLKSMSDTFDLDDKMTRPLDQALEDLDVNRSNTTPQDATKDQPTSVPEFNVPLFSEEMFDEQKSAVMNLLKNQKALTQELESNVIGAEELRQKYKTKLEATFPGEKLAVTREVMLSAFDSISSASERSIMFTTLDLIPKP